MFKEKNRPWLYLIGIMLMFLALVLATRDFMVPLVLQGEINTVTLNPVRLRELRMDIDPALDYKFKIITTEGEMLFNLYEKSAPINVNNISRLSNRNYYNNTLLHRIIPNTLVQGGDPNSKEETAKLGLGGPRYVVEDEINLSTLNLTEEQLNNRINEGFSLNLDTTSVAIKRYSLAMANDGPNTNGSQFFIVFNNISDEDLAKLNGRFTVIGELISGFDIIDKISQTETVEQDNYLKPMKDIRIVTTQVYHD